MKWNGKKPRLLRYLVFLALITSLIASGTLAKYAAEVQGGVSLQVASFAAEGTADFTVHLENVSPSPESFGTVQFAVRNYEAEESSQVQLNYTIKVETTGNLPLTFSLQKLNEPETEDPNNRFAGALVQKAGEASVWEAAGGVLPTVETDSDKTQHKYLLSAAWTTGETSEDYSHEIDMVTVTVTTQQASPTEGETGT